MLHYLAPMDFSDTRRMIHHRLKLSSKTAKPRALFTLPALWAIYRFTRGYPRKIIHLCHQSVLAMIIQNRSKAGWSMIRSCKNRLGKENRWRVRLLLLAGSATALGIAAAALFVPHQQLLPTQKEAVPIFKVPTETPTALSSTVSHEAGQSGKIPVRQRASDEAPAPATPPIPPQGDVVPAMPAPAAPATKNDEALAQVAVVEPIEKPPAVSAIPLNEPATPPEMLGRILVKPGDTLFKLVGSVYGRTTNHNMRAVIEANRHITDPNTIDLGDVINFPALQYRPDLTKDKRYWVVLEKLDRLDQAIERLYRLRQSGSIPLRILSNWSPSRDWSSDWLPGALLSMPTTPSAI